MSKRIAVGFVVSFLLVITTVLTSFYFQRGKPNTSTTPGSHQISLQRVQEFNALAGTPLVAKYNGIRSVKLVYELRSKTLYYIHSKSFRFHHDFCERILNFSGGVELFNQTSYTNTPLRKYVLANLNFYPELKTYALEFVTEDEVTAAQITTLWKAVQSTSFLKKDLQLLVNSDHLEKLKSELSGLSFLDPNTIYHALQYQQIGEGTAYGRLHYLTDEAAWASALPSDIVVVKGSPISIPQCQGIISNQFQTPLSHIQILSQSKRIPSMAFKSIFDEAYTTWDGKWVRLQITPDSFALTESTQAEYEQNKNRNTRFIPVVDLTVDSGFKKILPLKKLGYADKHRIGNKAANLAALQKLAVKNSSLFKTPEGGFAIPFYYYFEHTKRSGAQRAINELLQEKATLSPTEVNNKLKRIRESIKDCSLPASWLTLIDAAMREQQVGASFRFRSSSNAEDANGFSGAGLYTSKTGIRNDSVKTVARALRAVWASLWSEAAYWAREQQGIPQHQVGMAVLCHRNFPNEESNGVVVTKNIYRPSFPGYTVNVQVGELSVVDPDSGVVCDQFTVFKPSDFNPFSDQAVTDYIVTGNQNSGKRVLTSAQIQQLFKAIALCDDHFAMLYYRSHYADIEFKFEKGRLYLKQIRPYY